MFCAVIVAAGSSRRAGFDKLAAPLAGEPVLCRSVQAFVEAGCSTIVVVCPEERWQTVGLADATYPVPVLRVDGGAERQDSVAAGLAALPEGTRWVAVHDGARPLITPQGIRACLQAAAQTGAAACAHPVVDTLKRADADACSLPEKVSRDCLWGMETPQIFDLSLLQKAYAAVAEQGLVVTDEVSAVEVLGVPTRLVQVGPNLKITLPGDLELAELIWQHRKAR
ncbi:MAG: 2-C-methyl-D-erythritol 4-phosphate cytidylyltransferase [Akkermansia sp.]|nr:2-C-methyl-D-erythritol 4-phosphate cytidylyltransferase [Akkermansia sp.]